MSVFDVALKVKAKNGVLQEFIDSRGWTQAEFARKVGASPKTVGRWFNMTDYPRVLETMLKVATLVGKCPEQIFQEWMRDTDWLTRRRQCMVHRRLDIEYLPLHHMAALPAANSDWDEFTLKQGVEVVLKTLAPREEQVIRMRIGLGMKQHTHKECAKIFGVTPQRIGAIEANALKKLRGPSCKKILEEFVAA